MEIALIILLIVAVLVALYYKDKAKAQSEYKR
jgi:hypothetical protein